MKKLLFLLLTCVLLFHSCKTDDEKPAFIFNHDNFNELILKAINGSKSANDSLSGLIDYSIPISGDINLLSVDSILNQNGKIFYSVLIEHPNPVYNRFAIYDSTLNSFLIDKSLNGNLSLSKQSTGRFSFFIIKENFISKDTLELERLSLFMIDDSSASLSFRIFTKFKKPGVEYSQSVDEISEERIKTSIKSSKASSLNNKGDVFTFNNSTKTYLSGQEIFEVFVIAEINNYKVAVKKPEISDPESALESVGITPGADTVKSAVNTNSRSGFSLTLDENWKELRNVSIANYLKKELRGTRYLNNNLGASIFVISLAPEDSAEMHVDAVLNNSAEGNYKVKFSDKKESAKTFVQFFEFSCGDKKFLMIIETSRFTYERHRLLYEDIINSFVMDC